MTLDASELGAGAIRDSTAQTQKRTEGERRAAGEIAIFVRSRYDRAGAERVTGFADDEQARHVLDMAPSVGKAMVVPGIGSPTSRLEVGMGDQARRPTARIEDERQAWTLSPMNRRSVSRRHRCLCAWDAASSAADFSQAPRNVMRSDDHGRARQNIDRDLPHHVPDKTRTRDMVARPRHRKPGTLAAPDRHREMVADTVRPPTVAG